MRTAGFILFWAVAPGKSGAQEFIAPGTRVVLMSGLAGDLDSETLYRDQLQSWLNLLANHPRVAEILVLSDQPETVKLAGKSGRVFKSDRAGFAQLLETTRGGTNPTLAVVWGHGGKQGSQPVFHVRGPRLTPADFAKAAENWSGAESQWLLCFRGSGAFGREITRAGSDAKRAVQILTSDCDTLFNSDPVLHSVVLAALGRKSATFRDFCRRVASDTVSWYEERRLARTEEPTYWNPEPVLLAADSAPGGLAEAAETPEPKSEPTQPGMESVPATNALPDSWKGLATADPSQYRGEPAVVLKQTTGLTFGKTPAVKGDHETFIQVLTAEGKHFGDFDISFSPPQEEIDFAVCEVLGPDGKLTALDPGAIREAVEGPPGGYQAERRKVFSLPGVVPGAVLHVRYRTEWKTFPLPHVSMPIPLAREVPVLESTVEVTVPRDAPFHFALENAKASDPQVNRTEYGATYRWKFERLAAEKPEVLMPPERNARLLVSTFPDWRAFAGWYARITRLTGEVTPEIEAKARELTRAAHDDRDRVVALYNFVTSLRYVAVPIGVNSFRPHSAAEVLANQFGDCKDKANLLNALLRVVEIPASLVLVPRFSQAHPQVPGLSFNHAISKVTLGKETLWLDTTDDVCRFGFLPPGDYGRRVMVIDETAEGLVEIPRARAGDHRLKLDGRLAFSITNSGASAALTAVAGGFPDYELRSVARQAEEGAGMPLLAARFAPVAGSFALRVQESTPASNLDEDFAWRGQGEWVGLLSRGGQAGVLQSPFWLPREWQMALHRRRNALLLNQGYPLALEQEFVIELPPDATLVTLPEPSEQSAGPLRWKVQWAQLGERELSARLRVELPDAEVPAEGVTDFQARLRELIGAASGAAVLKVK